MSISTTGGEQQRRPGLVSTGKKAPGSKAAGGKPAGDETAEAKVAGEKAAGEKAAGEKPGAATKTDGARSGGAKAPAGTTRSPKGAAGKTAGAKSTGAKAGSAKAAAAKTAMKAGAGKGGGPRRPVTPVKVSTGRSWGPIMLFAAVGLLAAGIIGYGAWAVWDGARSWEDRAGAIDGIVNFRKTDTSLGQGGQHRPGKLQYSQSPPVGGVHNDNWQNCMGDIYDAPIANEHAVHSLEHGAVWITYRPDLAKDQVDKLAAKVRNKEKMMMSPYEGLDRPIVLQAWGYQLKVDNADDGRIDEFIQALRVNASLEGPTISCAQGITATGNEPRQLAPPQQQQPGELPPQQPGQ